MKIHPLTRDNESKILTDSKVELKANDIVSIVWENKKKWNLDSASQNTSAVFGYTSKELISSNLDFKQLIHPDDKEFVINEINNRSRTDQTFTLDPYRIITKSKETIWIRNQIFVQNMKEKKVTHFQGLFTKIEPEIQLQEELMGMKKEVENARRLDQITLKTSIMGSFLMDFETQQWIYSGGLENILGVNPNIYTNIKSGLQMVCPEFQSRINACIKTTLSQKLNFFNEQFKIINHQTKQELWVHCVGQIDYLGLQPLRMYGTVQNISEQKKKELQFENSIRILEDNIQVKNDFIKNITHEIRTPVNGILGFSKLLKRPKLSDEKKDLYINVVQKSCAQLLKIIEVIKPLELKNKQILPAEKEFFVNDLLEELNSVFNVRAIENNNTLILVQDEVNSGIRGYANHVLIKKILSNLIENAIKFTNSGTIEFGFKIHKDVIDFFVKDTGIGIPADKQKIIFERSTQLGNQKNKIVKGSGLGLSISLEDAESLGGRISLKSKEREGSIFVLSIPFKLIDSKEGVENKIGILPNTNKGKTSGILIVEDDDNSYLLLSIMLRDLKLGHSIIRAYNGEEAVNKCLINDTIKFVFMDLNMPIMDGSEATRIIKKAKPYLPIIVQTAYSGGEKKKNVISSGCDDFITKPLSQLDIKRVVNKYMFKQ